MSTLSVGFLRVGPDISVEEGNTLFEEDELNDGVWNLSSPEWSDTLIETGISFSGLNLSPSFSEFSWEGSWLRCLHLNLTGFERTQE